MSRITWDPRAPCSLSFSQGQDPWFLKLLALLHLGDIGGCGGGGGEGRRTRTNPPPWLSPRHPYLLADEQAVGVLDGSSFV